MDKKFNLEKMTLPLKDFKRYLIYIKNLRDEDELLPFCKYPDGKIVFLNETIWGVLV